MCVRRLIPVVCAAAVLAQPAMLAAQTVTVVGAADGQGLKFTTDVEQATFRIPLEPDSDIKGFSVTVDDFIGPGGAIVPAVTKLDGVPAATPLALKQIDRPLLYVTAAFRATGDYRSGVVLTYGDKRVPTVPLVVSRTRGAGTLDIEVVDAVEISTVRPASAPVRFVLQENAGLPVTIDPPTLVNLSRKAGDKSPKQARYSALRLTTLDESRARPPGTGSAASELTFVDATESSYSIAGSGRREFVMWVEGLRTAGEYTGTLRVTSRSGSPVNRNVTLYVKNSGWLAFFFILLGVSASWLFRRWVKDDKPRLESLRRIEDTEEFLDEVAAKAGTLSPDENRAVAAVRSVMAKIRRDVERGSAKDVLATMDSIDKNVALLPKWITTGRQIAAASSTVDVTRVRERWLALVELFSLRSADDSLGTGLTDIAKDLETALKEQVVGSIQNFQKIVDAAKAGGPPAEADTLDKAIKPLLDDASKKADLGKLPEARAALLEAKAAYVRAMTDRLILALNDTPLIGFDQARWQALAGRLLPEAEAVKKQADPDAAIAVFASLNRTYLNEVIAAARHRLTSARADVDQSTTISDDQKKTLEEALAEAEDLLRSATGGVATGHLDDASRSYREAADKLRSVDEAIRKSGGGSLGIGIAAARLASFFGAPSPTPPVVVLPGDLPRVARRPRAPADQLSALIARNDTLLNLAVLVIATVLGMSLLWAGDPVWGGWTSYTTAFLWGLGLHQVGNSSFEGLPAVMKKITE